MVGLGDLEDLFQPEQFYADLQEPPQSDPIASPPIVSIICWVNEGFATPVPQSWLYPDRQLFLRPKSIAFQCGVIYVPGFVPSTQLSSNPNVCQPISACSLTGEQRLISPSPGSPGLLP